MATLHPVAVAVDFSIGWKTKLIHCIYCELMAMIILKNISERILNYIFFLSFQSHPSKYNRPTAYVQHPPIYTSPSRVKFSVSSYI